MSLTIDEYVDKFVNIVKTNNLNKTDIGSTILAISVMDRISDDTSSRSQLSPSMLRQKTNNNKWNSLVHTVGICQSGNEIKNIDNVKIKRLICDTLTLLGVENESKFLMIPASKEVKENCHITCEGLETEESKIDSYFSKFSGAITEDKYKKVFIDVVRQLTEVGCNYTFDNLVIIDDDIYAELEKSSTQGYSKGDVQSDLKEALVNLEYNFMQQLADKCEQNEMLNLYLLGKYRDNKTDISNIPYETLFTKINCSSKFRRISEAIFNFNKGNIVDTTAFLLDIVCGAKEIG